ncbi:MAG: hypothetical protein ABF651_00015 [Sporolactobacillus sp.]
MYDERDRDNKNVRKAYHYDYEKYENDGIHRYEKAIKHNKNVNEMTSTELDAVIYKANFNANKGVLDVIMPSIREILGKQKALFRMMDDLIEDNRNLFEQLETVKRSLHNQESSKDENE